MDYAGGKDENRNTPFATARDLHGRGHAELGNVRLDRRWAAVAGAGQARPEHHLGGWRSAPLLVTARGVGGRVAARPAVGFTRALRLER